MRAILYGIAYLCVRQLSWLTPGPPFAVHTNPFLEVGREEHVVVVDWIPQVNPPFVIIELAENSIGKITSAVEVPGQEPAEW